MFPLQPICKVGFTTHMSQMTNTETLKHRLTCPRLFSQKGAGLGSGPSQPGSQHQKIWLYLKYNTLTLPKIEAQLDGLSLTRHPNVTLGGTEIEFKKEKWWEVREV